MIIKDLTTLKKFLQERVNFPIFGAGVYAFHRLGPDDFLPDYRILALRRSLEGELIKKDIEVLFIEKSLGKKHILEPRNATTVLKLKKTRKYLEKFKNNPGGINILVYKTSLKMEKICKENNWRLIAPSARFGKKFLENKINFRRILEELKVPVPPGKIVSIKNLHYGHLMNKYGLPFVIQHPTKGGGKGTFFIYCKEDFEKVYKNLKNPVKEEFEEKEEKPAKEVIVAKYIQGPSPSLTGCVTRYGILSTNLQHQILDIPELYNPEKGSGLFCGHDWASSNFSEEINQQAYEIVNKVGNYFKSLGYKGIFGLDFVLDEETKKLYVTETNPRLLGSFPTISMIQVYNNEPPILAFHILEYLDIDYQIDLETINQQMRKKKPGAQMILHNLTGKWSKIKKTLKAGIYQLDNNKLKYLRPGYKFQHLENDSEFLLTEGILVKGSPLSPNRRLGRVITQSSVLQDYNQLNSWGKLVAETTYQSFKIKPVRFIKIKKFFKPHFLAKG